MAIFGKNKGGDNGDGDNTGPIDEAFSPKKARAFFDRAKTVHESTNYAYAMQLWLNGLRFEPVSMDGLNGFLTSAVAFHAEAGDDGKGKSAKALKEARGGLTAKGRIGKYILALFDFGSRPGDLNAALRAGELAADLGLRDAATYVLSRAFELAATDKKQKKDNFVRLLNAFEKVEAYDLAVQAGNVAVKMDISDADLQNHVRNLGAQATMSRGGFDEVGEEGGFRKNIRDATKQRQLEEAERISKTEEVKDRLVAQAEEEYQANPGDVPVIEKYGRALRERGKNADELKAITLYTKAYKDTGQFKFRQLSGEIQIRRSRREVARHKHAWEASPEDQGLREAFEKARRALIDLEINELELQVEKYPTELTLKYELGKRYFEVGKLHEAIEQFQLAQEDAKHKRGVLLYMARAFMALDGWLDEAIATYRRALEGLEDEKSDVGMEIRYGLMSALQQKAETERDAASADEADKLAGGIAIQSFGYKDIRERREAIKKLITDLKSGG
ncbi:MAG: hypothetical protein R3B57_10455 [Phycisphaerales bacterium]